MSDESDEVEETEAADEAAEEVTDAETEEQGGDETAEAESTEAETDDDAAGLEDGDFVRIGYTARTVEGGQLVDTTDPEVAEEEGVDDQGTFEPRVIVLGEGHLFPEVENDIRGSEVGDEGTVVVPAAEAFGEYDEAEVETVSADKIDEDDRYPGARVQIDGQQGVLETIIGGRARVDFNHPLAGEDIEYDYEVLEVVEDDLERAEGLLSMFLDLELEMWIETDEVEETRVEEPDEDDEDAEPETVTETVEKTRVEEPDEDDEDAEPETVTETVEKRTLYVESDPQLAMNQQWMMQKQQIAQQIIDLTGVDRILIQEILDGSGMGMPGMMGGMGGGAGGDVDIEEALEEADIDADEIADEL
jgi:FKBP-type peptidyl-prolyl cis-trans isomerase SlyD